MEDLPDELILNLFENYVRLVDIYQAFRPLNNRRIKSILRSCSFSIDIPSKDIYHSDSFSFYSAQIASLSIKCYCGDLDLTQFNNLRSLHLEKPTREQLLSIDVKTFPNLINLSLFPCWYSFKELPTYLTSIIKSNRDFQNLIKFRGPDGKIIRMTPIETDFSRGL